MDAGSQTGAGDLVFPLVGPAESHAVELTGSLRIDTSAAVLPGGVWCDAQAVGDGLLWRFESGTLTADHHLTADLLLEGPHLAMFALELQEGQSGPTFVLSFGLLIDASARMRVPLQLVDQNRWKLEREGAWLKPICRGDRVDLARVDRMRLRVLRMADHPVRWCMTPPALRGEAPPRMHAISLPKGPLLDELGQLKPYDWRGKSTSVEQVTTRLHEQLQAAGTYHWPGSFDSSWGGWRERPVEASGFFRTHHDGRRWWLIDPSGHRFWSTGPNVLAPRIQTVYSGLAAALAFRPDAEGPFADAVRDSKQHPAIDYLRVNLIRAFGPEHWQARWEQLVAGQLRRIGFNSFANWSDWQAARRMGFAYVRPLSLQPRRTAMLFRDFPDVFDPRFDADVADYATPLAETAEDAGMIGYFLMNEPKWGFASLTPAEGMLVNSAEGHTRHRLADWLRQRYHSSDRLAEAWKIETTFAQTAAGPWRHSMTDAARRDLAAFSQLMATRLFDMLSAATRQVAPNHLNLGARYHTVPPQWSIPAMQSFDVFSMNRYSETVPPEAVATIADALDRPVLIGEWHFGALDAGLPASGIGRVPDQAQRGLAYRRYLEQAAALPACVGAHWFTLYDQSALGRGDGEAYNIGFIDVAHRPYEPLVNAARASHDRLYQVAAGELAPTDIAPTYLSRLF